MLTLLHAIVGWLWESAFAQFGIAGLALAGAVAVLIWVPSATLKHAAVIVAAVAVFFLIFAPRFYLMGVSYEKAKWEAAEAAAAKRADDARRQAESEIPDVPSVPGPALAAPLAAPAGPSKPGVVRRTIRRVLHPRVPAGVRGDPYQRDDH